MTSGIVRLRDVKRYRGGGERTFELVVPELRIERGRFVALVGASGSGKSTLLDLLGLVLRPSAGGTFLFSPDGGGVDTVDIVETWRQGNDDPLAALRRRSIGYVLQTGGLIPFLDVSHNIGLPLRLLGRKPEGRTISAALERLGLGGYEEKMPSTLSGGERQRVAILRALAHGPAMVLADEPTAALDRERARHVVEHFRELAQAQGTAIVMVTHDEQLVSGLADMVVRFNRVSTPDHAGTIRYISDVTAGDLVQ